MVFIAFQDSCNNRDCAILVGPCPSTSFIRSFHFRHLHGKEMLTSLCALRKITRDTWSSKQEEIDFTNSKNSPKKLLTKSLSFRMLFQPNLNTLSAERSFENILSCGRTLCAALELYFHSAVRVKYDSSSLQYFSSYCKILLQIVEEIVINGACNVMREVGNHIVFLDKDRIKLKIADIYRETVSRDVKNLPCVFTRGDSILVHSGQFVEECIGYLRCCFLLVCSLPSQPMTVSTVVDCITNEVIHYLQVATSSSFESKANFLRTEGMELKQNLIIFLIRVNQMWAESVKSLRMLIGITTLPKENPLLLPPLNDVLGWFIVSIRQDIHIWMSKSIDHYNGNRENNYSLPWDVQQLGNQWCSDIPETVAMQLKVYSDFDFHDLDNEYPFCVSELKYFRTELNDSISRSWYFLLSELTQAMLCRHWDSADEDATIGAFSHFLMSIGNDFLRVLARFVPKDSKDNKDIDIIQSMTTILIGHMTKLIFSTTQTTLLHFDSTWNQEVGNGCSIFITNLSHHFKKMKPCLHSMLFREVVLSCMKVVVLRYLLLLKNKILLSFGRAMESSEVDRLIEDEGRLSAFFHGFLEESVLESLLYMRHLCVILKQDHNNPLFKDSLLWILRLYDLSDFKQVQFVEFLLLTCFLPLRMEATTEIYIYVATQIRHFTENYQYRARISLMQIKETDMYWRLFADFRLGWDEESRPSQTDGNRVEIDETVVHNSFPSVLGTFTNNLSVLKPSQFISSLKKIREKISDVKFPLPLAINGYAPNSKEYDEVAAYIMRSINLDQKDSPAHLELVRLLQTLYIGKTELELVEKPFDQLSEINRPALFYSSIVQQDHGDVPMLEAISTLIIERIELRNVASHSVIGKANPYIVFKFGDIVFKTAVKWDCENCVWTEKMQQTISNNLLLNQRLSINVYDKERIRRKRFIGGIELLLNPYINRAHASWYALESSEVIATEIFLSFRILS